MIQSLFSSQSKSVTGAAVLLGAASFVSRAIGMLRDRIFAHTFGAGELLDAYYAAFRIPDLVYNLMVLGALSAGFIPLFLLAWEKEKMRAWQLANTMLNLLAILLLVVCGALFLAAPRALSYLVPGFSASQLNMAVDLTRIMLLSPVILGISSIVSGILQSLKLFVMYAVAPIVYNVGIMVGALVLLPVFGPRGLAYGVILGALLHLAIQLPTLIGTGFRYTPRIRLDAYAARIGAHMAPRLTALAAHQVNFLVATGLASTLPAGSIAILNFATNLQYVPVGIIGISFAVAAFPTLSEAAAAGNMKQFVGQLGHTVRVILFFIIPMTVVFMLLRAQIVRSILGSGGFDWRATIQTADALAFFSLSLFAQCLVLLFVRAFFALQDTRTPLLAAILTMILNVTASVPLRNFLGVPGLALAFSLATIFQISLLWLLLRRAVGNLEERRALHALYKISAAAIVMALVIQGLKTPLASLVDMTTFWGIFTQGAAATLAGLFVYGVICRLMRLQEMLHLQESFKRRWLKVRHVPREVMDVEPNG